MKKSLVAALAAVPMFSYAGICFDGGSLSDPACSTTGLVLEQVFFDAANDVNLITGHLGSQTDPRIVEFTSNDLISAANGFAQITGLTNSGTGPGGVPAGFDDLSFGMQSPLLTMDAVTFDLRTFRDGTDVTFDILDTNGVVTQFITSLSGSGLEQFTIVADPESMRRISFQASDALEVANFKHLRIDPDADCVDCGPDTQSIDAPANAALLSLGLIGLYVSRRKASK